MGRPRPSMRRGRTGSRNAPISTSLSTSSARSAAPPRPRPSGPCSARPSSPAGRPCHDGGPLVRPHRLEMTAFGPFAETADIDFDALADAGLFLIHGPTGAGKTSVLDAVCFALYGQVAGAHNAVKRLRSDHAPAAVGPRVVLEVTVRGRRLRITRSPTWQRPKLRGTGTTQENAKVVVEEYEKGSWIGRSTRLDEAGDFIGGLLGMTAEQFCQVAMLPQGEF